MNPWLLVLVGAAVSFLCAMLGIGGGLFAVPILHFAMGFELRRAVATSLGLVVATAFSATVNEVFYEESALRWDLVAVLVPGALLGAQLGFLVAKRLDTRKLRAVFVVVLGVTALRLLFGGDPGEGVTETLPETFSAATYALVVLIGLGGGFVAPLLGIGGGLVFVPALYLVFPALGFAGARACSLATAVIAASRSLWLYVRSGDASLVHVLWLGIGALLGATGGVWAVHLPGVAEYGRFGLAAVLLFVAGKFLRELLAARRAAEAQA